MNLKQLKALTEKATPGKWEAVPNHCRCSGRCRNGSVYVIGENTETDCIADNMTYGDPEFIAASRTALPELIAWVERAKPMLEAWKSFQEMGDASDVIEAFQIEQLLKEVEE